MIHQVHQDKQREANRRSRPVARFILSGCMLLALALGLVAPATLYPTPAAAAGIPTFDAAHIGETILEGLAAAGRFTVERTDWLLEKVEKSSAAVAYKSAL